MALRHKPFINETPFDSLKASTTKRKISNTCSETDDLSHKIFKWFKGMYIKYFTFSFTKVVMYIVHFYTSILPETIADR